MGRAILPELAVAMVAMVVIGLVLAAVGVAQWAASHAIVRQFQQRRQQLAREREATARRNAKWEARTLYQRGYAVVDLVRVARWDKKEVVIDTDDRAPVVVPEEDLDAVTRAQIEVGVRADRRNTQTQK